MVTEADRHGDRPHSRMHSSSLSCALLLDTTGSMQVGPAGAAERRPEAHRRIARDNDMVAVYSFQETVSLRSVHYR
jgi:hypothetical protein